MPAQKRSFEEAIADNEETENEINTEEQPKHEVESDQRHSSEKEEEEEDDEEDEGEEEYVAVKLSDVRKEVQCPICLGIIRKTRTVMECLHRFCRECIDKSMRLGNNECPACRTHCASRRSLRDDPNFDALIAAIYPDIDKYEEEELALHEDEMSRHKQFQTSIAQTLQRQSEALSKKQKAKTTVRTSQSNYQTSHQRRRRNYKNACDFQVSNDNKGMNDNDGGNDSSSDNAQAQIETHPRRCKKGGEQETQFSQHSASTDSDGVGDECTPEVSREIISASNTLSWGKNGHRSHNRVNGMNAKNNRISKLLEHLRISEANDCELPAFLMLVSFDEQRMPSLEETCLTCKPTVSVKKLCKHIANETALHADEVELWLVLNPQASIVGGERTIDPDRDNMRVLGDQQTLAELLGDYENTSHGYLVMAYKRKLQNSETVGLS